MVLLFSEGRAAFNRRSSTLIRHPRLSRVGAYVRERGGQIRTDVDQGSIACDAVAGHDAGGACGVQGRQRVVGEDAVHADADCWLKNLRIELPQRPDHAESAGDDVVHHYRRAAFPALDARQVHRDIAIAATLLAGDDERRIQRAGHRADPLGALAVRADDQRRCHLAGDPLGDARCGVGHPGLERIRFGQIVVTMQVRIDREQPVERGTQQVGEDPCRNCFAGMKAGVLAHVGQIGRHQPDPHGAQLAHGGRGHQQRHHFRIRPVERADQRRIARRDRWIDPYQGFFVGEPVQVQVAAGMLAMPGQQVCKGLVAGHGVERDHGESVMATMLGCRETYSNAYASSPGLCACKVKSGSPLATASPRWRSRVSPASGEEGAPASLAARDSRRLSIAATVPERTAATGWRQAASPGMSMPPWAAQISWNCCHARPERRHSAAIRRALSMPATPPSSSTAAATVSARSRKSAGASDWLRNTASTSCASRAGPMPRPIGWVPSLSRTRSCRSKAVATWVSRRASACAWMASRTFAVGPIDRKSAGAMFIAPPQTTQPPLLFTAARIWRSSRSTGASMAMVSAVPAGEVIAREEVLGMVRPMAVAMATTIGVVRLPASPPMQCLSTTIGRSQRRCLPVSTIARVSAITSSRPKWSLQPAMMKAASSMLE